MSSLLPCFLALHISRLAMQKSDTVASSREHCPAAATDFFVLLLEFQNASNILMLHKNATDAAALLCIDYSRISIERQQGLLLHKRLLKLSAIFQNCPKRWKLKKCIERMCIIPPFLPRFFQ